jgi:asparaginyl-tRNA synthetase
MLSIKEIYSTYTTLLDTPIQVNGWVQTTRTQKDMSFIKINDGSYAEGIQVVVDSSVNDTKYSIGMSLQIDGILIKSPAAGQLFELQSNNIVVVGNCDPTIYPLSKGKMSLDYLRSHQHLRPRTNTFGCVFRIKSRITQATHRFYEDEGYFHLDPNILTVNECEGGAGVFQVTEKDISSPKELKLKEIDVKDDSTNKMTKKQTDEYDWMQDHFGKPVYLTVSSQLSLEPLACALGKVYTTNKSFRSEHSVTHKHLSEFSHLEIEACFLNLEQLMDISEKYIKYVGNYLLDKCASDIAVLDSFVSKGIKERIENVVSATFYRVKYLDAIKIAQEKGKLINYGEDLSSEIESALTEHFNGPVFVYNWPISIKSFYMKRDLENPEICNNFDLLMPYRVGELIGGSMREDDYDKLIEMMKVKGVSEEPMKFYTDLRKFGSVPHGGFGLGLDRMTMLFTGIDNIKDTVPFPVSYKSCDY